MNEKTGTGVGSEKEKIQESQFNTVPRTHQPPRRGWGHDMMDGPCDVDTSSSCVVMRWSSQIRCKMI